MLSHSQSLLVICTSLALSGSASAFSVQNHHQFAAAKSSNFKSIPKKNQIPFKTTTRLESLLPHANDNEKPSLSKRERVRRKGKQIFLFAAFSTSMIFRGTAQPANAWGREAAATVKPESKVASSNVFPVVATVGGIILAKKLLSKDDSDDEVDTKDDNKETLENLMSAKKDITESEDLKHAAAQREARRNARIEEDSRRAGIEQARRGEEARKIADQLKAEKGAKLRAEAEAKANADAVSKLEREEEEQARCEENARKIADQLEAELGAKLKAEDETRKIADQLKDEKAAKVKAEAEVKANADAVSRLEREEEERAAAEEAAKCAAEEYKISAAETTAKAEEERLAAEVAAEKEEDKRLAAEAAAKAKEERLAIEAAAKEEEDRKAAEEAAKLKKEAENAQIKSAKLKGFRVREARVRQELSNPSAKYADINDPGERAYQILVDLGMVAVTPDPEDASYDSSKDDEFV